MNQSWTLRIGAMPTPEQLLPREYACLNGKRVRATLSIAAPYADYDRLLDTYTYEGRPANGMQLDVRPGSEVLTKPHTELNGAVRIFCCLGLTNLAFEERKTPFPDLHVNIDGKDVFLEIAQVRRDAPLHAALRDAQRRVQSTVAGDGALRHRLSRFSIVFGCASMPRQGDMEAFVSSVVEWLRALRSRPKDGPVLDPLLAQHILHVSTFPANADAPVKFALLRNSRIPTDYLDDILDMIGKKTRKQYKGSPLWLGLIAVDDPSAVMLRLRECDVEIGQFERILVTDTQDVLSFEAIT